MASIEKMNVYIVTKTKILLCEKNGKWFNNLFLPLFKSNNDPLKKVPKLDEYWNEIRNVLLGKKKNSKLKVIKHKDIKFIAFPAANGQILAFVNGKEKSDALEDIYKIAQEKSSQMNYIKFLKIINAKDTEALNQNYTNMALNVSDKDIKDWGYKNVEDMIKSHAKSNDFDFEHPYCNGHMLGTSIELSKWTLKEWAKEINSCIASSNISDYKTAYLKSIDEQKIDSEENFGKWIIENYCHFKVVDANTNPSNCTFTEFMDYYATKDVYSNLKTIYKALGVYYAQKKNTKSTMSATSIKRINELFDYLNKELDPIKDIKLSLNAQGLLSVQYNNFLAYVQDKNDMYILKCGLATDTCKDKEDVLKALNKNGLKDYYSNNEKLQELYDYLKEHCYDDFECESDSADAKLKNNKLTIDCGNASYTITCKDQEYKVLDNVTKEHGYYNTIAEVLEVLGIEEDNSLEDKIYQVKVYDIDWDTHNEDSDKEYSQEELKLPKSVSLYNIEANSEEEVLQERIANILSDNFGYCVNSMNHKDLKIQTEDDHDDVEDIVCYENTNFSGNEEVRCEDKLDKRILYSDILDWISDHDQAWHDFLNGDYPDDVDIYNIQTSPEDTIAWIIDHNTLYEDFCNRFRLDPDFVEETEVEKYIKNDLV